MAEIAIVSLNTGALIQSLNQYTVGLLGGYIIDLLMDQVPISADNIYGRLGRQLIQTGLNGIALSYMIQFIHGNRVAPGYRDPTGGYLLAIGLIQAQPSYMKNGKELIQGLSLFIKESIVIQNPDAPVTDTAV